MSLRELLVREMQAFLTAFSFFTRIPVQVAYFRIEESVFYLPIVGYLLGAVLYFFARVLSPGLNSWLLAWVLLVLQYYFANYFHFDGLLDTVDALAFHGNKKQKLEILKVPEIGVLGFLFAFFFLLGEFLLLREVIIAKAYWIIAVRPAAGRLTIGIMASFGKPAKDEGLGSLFLKGVNKRLFLSQVFWIPIFFFAPLPGLCAICISLILVWRFNREFGGLTGDMFGAGEEIAEFVFLAIFVLGLK